jgi:hypothetical protein
LISDRNGPWVPAFVYERPDASRPIAFPTIVRAIGMPVGLLADFQGFFFAHRRGRTAFLTK